MVIKLNCVMNQTGGLASRIGDRDFGDQIRNVQGSGIGHDDVADAGAIDQDLASVINHTAGVGAD
ncbi:hypothetical protein Pla52n_68790 [Stieleria varia]|uniref:Uncharacterized protein n=1 Tax=Stieleria varia TaxID=2528005 RepID=A0A5C5ZQ77_9BACT|nr:hypothetical protein Pla52n_68790 [Stieleria varia]